MSKYISFQYLIFHFSFLCLPTLKIILMNTCEIIIIIISFLCIIQFNFIIRYFIIYIYHNTYQTHKKDFHQCNDKYDTLQYYIKQHNIIY
jgi:hypothetical protein